jgi:hypothetical protein
VHGCSRTPTPRMAGVPPRPPSPSTAPGGAPAATPRPSSAGPRPPSAAPTLYQYSGPLGFQGWPQGALIPPVQPQVFNPTVYYRPPQQQFPFQGQYGQPGGHMQY